MSSKVLNYSLTHAVTIAQLHYELSILFLNSCEDRTPSGTGLQTSQLSRVVSDTGKFDRGLKAILHDELHWLDVPERMSTRLVRWCAGACTDRHLATLQTTSSQPLMLHPVVFVYDQPTGIVSLYLAVDSARMAVGRSTTSARQSGTRYQMNLEIPTVLITLNGS